MVTFCLERCKPRTSGPEGRFPRRHAHAAVGACYSARARVPAPSSSIHTRIRLKAASPCTQALAVTRRSQSQRQRSDRARHPRTDPPAFPQELRLLECGLHGLQPCLQCGIAELVERLLMPLPERQSARSCGCPRPAHSLFGRAGHLSVAAPDECKASAPVRDDTTMLRAVQPVFSQIVEAPGRVILVVAATRDAVNALVETVRYVTDSCSDQCPAAAPDRHRHDAHRRRERRCARPLSPQPTPSLR